MNETLWLVIIMQGFVLAWMLLYALRYLFNKSISKIWTLASSIIISTCTAASFHSSMLMPDIFTPIMVMSATFLWNFKNRPLYKIGGWTDANQKASAKLVKDILSRPKYLKRYLIRCIEDSFIQLFYFHIQVSPRVDNVGKEIRKHFPMYTTPYMISRQSQETMDTAYLKFVNILQSMLLALSFILIFFFLFDKHCNHFIKAIVIVMLIMIYANSFISVAASGIYARYNSRILWLITLPAFVYLWQLISAYLNFKGDSTTTNSD